MGQAKRPYRSSWQRHGTASLGLLDVLDTILQLNPAVRSLVYAARTSPLLAAGVIVSIAEF